MRDETKAGLTGFGIGCFVTMLLLRLATGRYLRNSEVPAAPVPEAKGRPNNFPVLEGDSPIFAGRKSGQSPSCSSAAP